MSKSLPIILVPGLVCSPRIYAPQIPALWQRGPVMLANHIRDSTMAGIAKRILDEAPRALCHRRPFHGRLTSVWR